MARTPKLLSGPALSRVAARCEMSPTTVRRRVAGEKVSLHNARAIDRALRAEGLAHMIPGGDAAPTPATVSPSESAAA